MIEHNGETMTVVELSRRTGIPTSTLYRRYARGLRGDQLVKKGHLKSITHFGRKASLSELSRVTGIPVSTLKGRHALGLRDRALITPHHRGKGTTNGATKLNEEKVRAIKTLLLTSGKNQREISELFDIHQSHVSDIKRGKRWGHVKVSIE